MLVSQIASRNISVDVVIDDRGIVFRFPRKHKTVLQIIRTGSGTNTPSYSMGTGADA
jgi:hypothetical protein